MWSLTQAHCATYSKALLALAAAAYFQKYLTSFFHSLTVWAVPNTSVLPLAPQSFVTPDQKIYMYQMKLLSSPQCAGIPPKLINPTVASSLKSCDFPHFIPLIHLKDISTFLTSSLVNSLLLMATASSLTGHLWFDMTWTLMQKVFKSVYMLNCYNGVWRSLKLWFSTALVSRTEGLSDFLWLCCHAAHLASIW